MPVISKQVSTLVPDLWIYSVEFAAKILNAKHIASGNTETRHKLATGSEFNGRELLLGQLVHYRVDPLQRGSSMHHQNLVCFVVGVMILDPNLSRMYYVLDDNKVKNQESGYTNAIAVPAEELFVEEKEPVLP